MNLEQLRREWVSASAQKGALQAQIWDARAQEYIEKPLPLPQKNPFLKYMAEKVQINKEMSILDIGCGAGAYSLVLAKHAGQVVGTDVSSGMIAGAEDRAHRLGLSNVQFFCEDWGVADVERLGWQDAFDVVFAHMTPAVCDFATLEKLLSCAKKHCFLVKPARRTDKVQDEAFAQAGVPLQRAQMDDMIQNTFAFLWMMGICPEVTYRDEIWQIRRTTEDMTQWCAGRARLVRGLSPKEEQRIASYLEAVSENGYVEETVTTKIVTMYWNMEEMMR